MRPVGAAPLPETVRRAVAEAARRHGMEEPRVFGSRVTGEVREGSDLDLLVRLGPGRGWRDFLAFCEEAEAAAGMPVDVVLEDGLSPYLRDSVLAEAVPL